MKDRRMHLAVYCLTTWLGISACRGNSAETATAQSKVPQDVDADSDSRNYGNFRLGLSNLPDEQFEARYLMPLAIPTVNATLVTDTPETPLNDLLVDPTIMNEIDKEPVTDQEALEEDIAMPLAIPTVNATLVTDTPETPLNDLLVDPTIMNEIDKEPVTDQEALEEDIAETEKVFDMQSSLSLSMNMNYSISNQKTKKSSKKSKKHDGTSAPSTTFSPTLSPSITPAPSITYSPTSSKSKKSSKSESYSPTQTLSPTPSSKSSKNQKTPAPVSKGSETVQKYEGRYVRLVDFGKTCSSNGECLRSTDDNNRDKMNNYFCQGGMDVTQEFRVPDWGRIQVHLDISWDFGLNSYGCARVSKNGDTLVGNGWLPIIPGNSFICFTEELYRIPQSPNLNEHFFSGTMEVELPDGQLYDGLILAGSVCEMYSEGGSYLQILSLELLGLISGYSISLRYELDEQTMEVMEVLSGAPHIILETDDSMDSGKWNLLRQEAIIL